MTPITVITGFLGAGKTTLLNRILAGAHGLRIGVLVNDFGAVNVDAQLVDPAADGVVSLDNGCICCSLADGLLAGVAQLLRRSPAPQHLIVETSGISDPFEVAQALSDPELRPYAHLASIVTLLDAEALSSLSGESLLLVRRQAAAADLVLLSKADLLDATQLDDARAWLGQQAPGVRSWPCAHGDVPLDLLLAVQGDGERPAPPGAAGAHHGEPPFESFCFERGKALPVAKLHALLAALPSGVLRAKGILHLAERPTQRCVLQATPRRAAITVGDDWGERTPRSQIVFIGERGAIDEAVIRRALDDPAPRVIDIRATA